MKEFWMKKLGIRTIFKKKVGEDCYVTPPFYFTCDNNDFAFSLEKAEKLLKQGKVVGFGATSVENAAHTVVTSRIVEIGKDYFKTVSGSKYYLLGYLLLKRGERS